MNFDQPPKKNDDNKPKDSKPFLKKALLYGTAVLAMAGGMSKNANAENRGDPVNKDTTKISATVTNSLENTEKKFDIKQLTEKQMEDWNKFVDFVEAEGFKGSPELDVKNQSLAQKLFKKFKEKTPDVSFDLSDPSLVASIQQEMQSFAESARAFAARKNDPNAVNYMTGTSKIDGWAGSRTTQYKFPSAVLDKYQNDALVSTTDLGLVGGGLVSTKAIAEKKMIKAPDGNFFYKGKKAELMSDGQYYIEDDSGDLVAVK